MVLQAPLIISIGYESVETPSLPTLPSSVAEEKVQEEIRLAEWRIKQRQIICDVDMIIKELNTLGKRKMQDGNR
ncbi:hypothetical protein V6N13_032838 [Hibiscus sabdariffa]